MHGCYESLDIYSIYFFYSVSLGLLNIGVYVGYIRNFDSWIGKDVIETKSVAKLFSYLAVESTDNVCVIHKISSSSEDSFVV